MPHPELLSSLLTPAGQEALQEAEGLAAPALGFLPLYQQLARRHPDHLARAAAEQALLRLAAADKFSGASRMYFEREALEQATAEPLAHHRAERFRGAARVFDLCCGLGGDALALAEVAPVVAVDLLPHRLHLLRANAHALGRADRITSLCADVRHMPWRLPHGSAAFFDPSRRRDGRRVSRTGQYAPPLTVIDSWLGDLRTLAVKVSPAVDLQEIVRYDCEIEFVAWKHELREAVLWFGCPPAAARRATILPGPHSLTGDVEPELEAGEPLSILYEPNPAVLRAGLVRTLGLELHARQLDPTTAFLTAARFTPTAFARAYRIREVMPFQAKALRARLRQDGVGRLTVKTRGSAVTPESLQRQLHLRGDGEATVVLTRILGRPSALIVEPVAAVEVIPGA